MKYKTEAHRGLAATLASAALLFAAVAPAIADVQIDYDLSASRITTFAGLVELSPTPTAGAPFGGASARITLTGDLLDPQDGPALLEDFQLGSVPINENLFDVLSLQGSASAQQVGAALGMLVDRSSVIVSSEYPLALATGGSVVCTPFAYCGSIGSFPLDLAGIQSLTPLSFELRNVDVRGRSTVSGRIPLQLNGHSAVVDLVGVEVSRRFVPEPGTLAQLAAGCAGLLSMRAMSGLARRRRTRIA